MNQDEDDIRPSCRRCKKEIKKDNKLVSFQGINEEGETCNTAFHTGCAILVSDRSSSIQDSDDLDDRCFNNNDEHSSSNEDVNKTIQEVDSEIIKPIKALFSEHDKKLDKKMDKLEKNLKSEVNNVCSEIT